MRFAAVLFFLSGAALANPRVLPFSYPVESLATDAIELEQFIDATPIKAFDQSGKELLQPSWTLFTEIEYGLTDRLEAAFYLQAVANPTLATGNPFLTFDGIKQRLRYRLLDEVDYGFGLALYGEIAELRNEIELEGKIILQKTVGPLKLITNLWVEREYYFDGRREWVLNPTAGAAWQFHPMFTAGLEYWLNWELPDTGRNPALFAFQPHHFVGPTVSFQRSRIWWSTGAYLRLDSLNRAAQSGDAYGRVYVRTVLGLSI